SAFYAYLDLRSRRAERRMAVEREARSVATALRFNVESQLSAFRAPSEATVRDLSRAAGGWKVTVLTGARASARPLVEASDAQLRRLNAMVLVPKASADIEGGQYYYDLPIRAAASAGSEPEVTGMLEISRPADALDATSDDVWRVAALLLLIV